MSSELIHSFCLRSLSSSAKSESKIEGLKHKFSPEEKYLNSQKIIWAKQKELCPNTGGLRPERKGEMQDQREAVGRIMPTNTPQTLFQSF